MGIWVVKAVVQKSISFLPFSHKINYLFQKYITKGISLNNELVQNKLTSAQEHIAAFQKYKSENSGYTVSELGTGWFPFVPMCLYLNGATQINTFDLSRLLNKENVLATAKKITELHKNNVLQKYFQVIPDRINTLEHILTMSTVENMLSACSIHYHVGDASDSKLPNQSQDLIVSNNVFEHIPESVLKNILGEFKRIAKKGGIMSHFIDMSDHYAHMDSSINIYNFLRFSERRWKLIDNSIQPMNRLRINDYRALYSSLSIAITEEQNRPGNIETLNTIMLAEKFKSLPPEEVAISHSLFISKMG